MKSVRRKLTCLTGTLLLPVFAFAADPQAKPEQPPQPQEQPRSMDQPKSPATGPQIGWPGAPGPLSTDADNARMTQWEVEKQRVESALPPGRDKSFYRDELHSLGYQLTSVNRDRADYVEYEILKSGNTFEVQIALDAESGKAKQVKVQPNAWKARGTKQAIRQSQQQRESRQ